MQFGQLCGDDDAVTPVIGILLVVAIVVVLSAVIAAFALDVGTTDKDVAPTTDFEFDYDGTNTLTVRVSGGETVPAEQISFAGESDGFQLDGSDLDGANWTDSPEYGGGEELGAGDSVTFEGGGDAFEIEVVWTAEDGDTSTTLGSTSGPAA